ncbi:protein FAM43A-like [Liolophura sinensis]|uniref:protein FAM43A-like n=1 Tax=Liolophura sinensis TaxID=3198878 RepID=UPI0031590A68
MNIFKRKGCLSITEKDPIYKVRYLGNVQTAMMKGDGCVDKPVNVLWNNYLRTTSPGLDMKLTVSSAGLKAYTKEQGLTEYRAHRISYCIAHPSYPKLFVWVYRHEGKRMKVELRCHAVLCKTETQAKVMAVKLHDKLSLALKEFLREKTRNQNARLVLQRTNSIPRSGSVVPLRKQLLSTGQSYKPPVSTSTKAPKLGSISEDIEEEEEEDDFIEAGIVGLETVDEDELSISNSEGSSDSSDLLTHAALEVLAISNPESVTEEDIERISDQLLAMELGNNIEELKRDERVLLSLQQHVPADSDEESSESGFHDQDTKDSVSGTSEDGDLREVEEAEFSERLREINGNTDIFVTGL